MKTIAPLAIFCLCAASLLHAEEKKADEITPPVERGFASMSPEEYSAGWLLLLDGRTLFGWEARSLKGERRVSVPDPVITMKNGQTRIETEVPIELKTRLFLPRPWRVALVYRAEPGTSASIAVHDQSTNMYLKKFSYPLEESAESKAILIEGAGEVGADITMNGTAVAPGAMVEGGTGIALTVERGTLTVETLLFLPASRALFDGTLSGWQTLGEIKAETVEADGQAALHITGGSGSLESTGQFDNFYLSLDFKELAAPNNSGFFFRTEPGSKMDGYEAQMNNAPPEADRAKFLGNDTGSIFRRAAARRLAANPADWTRLTVMAEADFFRTWVNGVPALLWTDTRKSDPNPRKGLRLKRGTFQLQGHDPTTDLFLRNLRISDYGAGTFE